MVRYEPGFRAGASVSQWPVDIYTLEGEMTAGDRTYSASGAEAVSHDVLEGEMTAGDRTYRLDTYHYRPAGTPIGPVCSSEGVTRLLFTADSTDPAKSPPDEVFVQNVVTDVEPDPPTFRAVDASADGSFGASGESAREMFDHGHLPAARGSLGGAAGHVGERWRKVLRRDPVADIAVRVQRVHKVGVLDCVEKVHRHPWIEEVLLIRGNNQDYDAALDGHWRWIPGTYVCRPPGDCLHGDATKLDDDYYMVVRSGWTPDDEKAAEWRAWQDATEVPLPGPIDFQE